MNLESIKLSIFKDLQSYDSKPVGLDTVLWWIKNDQEALKKSPLYQNFLRMLDDVSQRLPKK